MHVFHAEIIINWLQCLITQFKYSKQLQRIELSCVSNCRKINSSRGVVNRKITRRIVEMSAPDKVQVGGDDQKRTMTESEQETVEQKVALQNQQNTTKSPVDRLPLVSTLLRASRDGNEVLIKSALRDIIINGITKEELNATDKSGRVSQKRISHFLSLFFFCSSWTLVTLIWWFISIEMRRRRVIFIWIIYLYANLRIKGVLWRFNLIKLVEQNRRRSRGITSICRIFIRLIKWGAEFSCGCSLKISQQLIWHRQTKTDRLRGETHIELE